MIMYEALCATCDCELFRRHVLVFGFPQERLIAGIRGRRQVEATNIARKHRIIAERRRTSERVPENYMDLAGHAANVFGLFTG